MARFLLIFKFSSTFFVSAFWVLLINSPDCDKIAHVRERQSGYNGQRMMSDKDANCYDTPFSVKA